MESVLPIDVLTQSQFQLVAVWGAEEKPVVRRLRLSILGGQCEIPAF